MAAREARLQQGMNLNWVGIEYVHSRKLAPYDVPGLLFGGRTARHKYLLDKEKKTRPPPRGPGTARENDACS
jgi:hypothetical protein